jgi:NAD(P)H-dependent FMN reductase
MACIVLLISGSLRSGSVNTAVLKSAEAFAPADVVTRRYAGLGNLPPFNPDDDRDPLNPYVADLRMEVGRANAVLICTPEYAGALPGAFKNLLDWMVGSTEMNAKPVAWINAASQAAPAGGEDAHTSLRKVLGYLDARIVEQACARIPISRNDIDSAGLVREGEFRNGIVASLAMLVRAANTI